MNDTERKFYKVFDIKPATIHEYGATYFWDTVEIDGERYTPISDRILLELMCLYTQVDSDRLIRSYSSVERLKDSILSGCICNKKNKKFKQQVQALFSKE